MLTSALWQPIILASVLACALAQMEPAISSDRLAHDPSRVRGVEDALLASITDQRHDLSHADGVAKGEPQDGASAHTIVALLAEVQQCKCRCARQPMCPKACRLKAKNFELSGFKIPYPS